MKNVVNDNLVEENNIYWIQRIESLIAIVLRSKTTVAQ